jgi:plasmid stabilization system protein ParE
VNQVVFRREASVETLEAFNWYEANRAGLGAEFRNALDATIERIASHPESYAPGYRQLRRAFVRRFPFAVHFRVVGEVVLVIGVVHLKRHPGVVKSR